MAYSIRPRRSLLFVPAANQRALQTAVGLPADGLIYDLEEAVKPEEKDAAREALRSHLAETRFAGERIVRINGLDTRWGTEDFLMARGARVDAILMPKVEEPKVMRQIAEALTETDASDALKLWAMIESPLGILNAATIAGEARTRLTTLVVGVNIIKLATGVRPDAARSELLPWLMQIVLAAKAHGLATIDGLFADIRDTDGFDRECASARHMGFDGKVLIHPNQIEPANRAFAPDEKALAWARAVVAAFEKPENAGLGQIAFENRMLERLHFEEALKLLALRDAIAARETPAG